MKKSSIEWLEQIIKEMFLPLSQEETLLKYIQQAKEIHKQETIEAYEEGQKTPYEYSEDNDVNYYDGRNYYKNTYEKEH